MSEQERNGAAGHPMESKADSGADGAGTRQVDPAASCSGPDCGCGSASRRSFLQAVGIGAATAVAWTGIPAIAGEPAKNPAGLDPEHLIPLDKRLKPEWIASLTARGEPEVYTGKDTRFIGMPVGGICAGTLYLGGDGRLWIWNIFNRDVNGVIVKTAQFEGHGVNAQNGANYVEPSEFFSPVEQGFAIHVKSGDKTVSRRLARDPIKDVSFCGQYPIGTVTYRDPELPVGVKLEAFSPFIPLNEDDSGLPATILQFTLTNDTDAAVETSVVGWLENAVLMHNRQRPNARRRNDALQGKGMVYVLSSASEAADAKPAKPPRPEIVFEDWQKETYEGWTVEGTAFGPGPTLRKDIPQYQGDLGGEGQRIVNSHNYRASKEVRNGDAHVGKLISKAFAIERNFITFWIGGGNHKGKTCLNLVVDGKVARSATGRANNKMNREVFDVRDLQGKQARIEIVDDEKGAWGNIGVSTIRFTDAAAEPVAFADLPDLGTMALAVLSQDASVARASCPAGELGTLDVQRDPIVDVPADQKLIGSVGQTVKIAPKSSATITFVIAWNFPNLSVASFRKAGRHYAAKFASAEAVLQHVSQNFDRLASQTRLWRDTWYDSSLPHWFLNRTFANTSILATTTCYRFKDGRFWGWEGIGCCAGTCTHVWHYAQAVGRIFPELERILRERVDLGVGLDEKTGAIRFRAENNNGPAIDGQAGVILRLYREHQVSKDAEFLKRVWPRAKRALQFLIDRDANGDGLIEGGQHNTLDADWFGKVPWLCGLYHAALRAGEEMAREMGDEDFARACRAIFDNGIVNLSKECWSERHGFYVQVPDPAHAEAIAIVDGCEIDQVLGQSWAWQVGLGRVMNEAHTKRQLKSLWDFNFTPDIGPLRAALAQKVRGRPYAIAGDAGLVMCTWPHGGRRKDWEKHWQYGYFNECMSGFEWQVSAHMIWEGMVTEGLAIARAIHDRYSGKLRNPYNEVECSDHYARAMASYGAFIAACGFEYHGPRGHMAFAPRLGADNFRAAFTAAQGWGTYAQKLAGEQQTCELSVKWGQVKLKSFALHHAGKARPGKVTVRCPGGDVQVNVNIDGPRVVVTFGREITLNAGESLVLIVG